MRLIKGSPLAAALALACVLPAFAQSSTTVPVKNAAGATVSVAGQTDAGGNFHYRDVMEGLAGSGVPAAVTILPDGGVVVDVSGLAPLGEASIAATTTSASTAATANATTVVATNTGAAAAYLNFGGSGVTATTGGYLLQAGESRVFALGANAYVAAVTASGSTTVALTFGTGQANGWGGASSGGGSVTVSNFPSTQAVSGTVSVGNFPSTQPVSGAVAATQSGAWLTGGLTSVLNTAQVTRPANTTAYTANSIVCSSAPACAMQVTVTGTNSATGTIGRVSLWKTGASSTGNTFDIYLFSAAPTVTGLTDRSPYVGPYAADAANYLGALVCSTAQSTNDGTAQAFYECAPSTAATGGMQYQTVAGQKYVYAILAATGPYVPISAEVFTLYINAYKDQ